MFTSGDRTKMLAIKAAHPDYKIILGVPEPQPHAEQGKQDHLRAVGRETRHQLVLGIDHPQVGGRELRDLQGPQEKLSDFR